MSRNENVFRVNSANLASAGGGLASGLIWTRMSLADPPYADESNHRPSEEDILASFLPSLAPTQSVGASKIKSEILRFIPASKGGNSVIARLTAALLRNLPKVAEAISQSKTDKKREHQTH